MSNRDWKLGFMTGAVTSAVLLLAPAIITKIVGL